MIYLFGNEPSNFALICYKNFVKHQVKKILELRCSQGRDSIFASQDLKVYAIDSSKVAIETLTSKPKELNLDGVQVISTSIS
jgi:hypothetical protein